MMSLLGDTLPKVVHQGQGMQQEGEARRPECSPLLPLVDSIRKVWAELSTSTPSTVFEHSNVMFLAGNVYETNRAATKQDRQEGAEKLGSVEAASITHTRAVNTRRQRCSVRTQPGHASLRSG